MTATDSPETSRTRRAVDWLVALAGIHRRRTLVAVALLAAVLGVLIAATVLPRWFLLDGGNTALAAPVDLVIGSAILLALLVNVGAIAYALWNGGPGLSFVIPLAPLAVGWAFAGQMVVSVDLALALASGTAGAVLATFRACRHVAVTGNGNQVRVIESGIAITAFGAVLGGVVLWRVADAAGPHATGGVWVASVMLVVVLVILVTLLGLLGRVSTRTNESMGEMGE